MKSTRNYVGVYTMMAGIFLILSGCLTSPFEQNTVRYQDDLGTVHVTLFPPMHYDAYRNDLQPSFKFDSEDALNAAVPITQRRADASRSEQTYTAAVALPTVSNVDHKLVTTSDGIRSSENTSERKLQSNAVDGAPVATSTLAPLQATAEGDIKVDPFLKYWTATALYQEVHLLNRLYKDLGVDDDYEPYIVRLEVACMTKLRNAPYDAVVDVSFSVEQLHTNSIWPESVRIIPCLVTDNVETRACDLSSSEIINTALELSGGWNWVSAAVAAKGRNEFVRSLLGREHNSLLTVGRLSDNTIRVRLGAMQQAGSIYAMVPRTHKITLIALVKKEDALLPKQRLNAYSKVSMYDANKGTKLPARRDDDSKAIKQECIRLFGEPSVMLNLSTNATLIAQLTEEVKNSNREEFLSLITCLYKKEVSGPTINPPTRRIRGIMNALPPLETEQINGAETNKLNIIRSIELWGKISKLLLKRGYDFSSIPLPQAPARSDCRISDQGFVSTNEPLSVLDDGNKISVHIRNAGRPKVSRFQAMLSALDQKNKPITFSATSVSADNDSTGLLIEFPSTSKWTANEPKTLSLFWVEPSGQITTNWVFDRLDYTLALDKDVPAVELSLVSPKIIARDANNIGSFRLKVSKWETGCTNDVLAHFNADVKDISPAGILSAPNPSNNMKILANGIVTVKLENLFAEQQVEVTAKTKKGQELSKPQTLTVEKAK